MKAYEAPVFEIIGSLHEITLGGRRRRRHDKKADTPAFSG